MALGGSGWLAVGWEGHREGVAFQLPLTRAQTAAASCSGQPTITVETVLPNLTGLQKPSLIGSRALGSLFLTGSSQEQAFEAGLGLGGGVQQLGLRALGCMECGTWRAERSWEETFEHTGVSRRWEDGKPQLVSPRPSTTHPFQAIIWPHNDLSTENLDHGLPLLRAFPCLPSRLPSSTWPGTLVLYEFPPFPPFPVNCYTVPTADQM